MSREISGAGKASNDAVIYGFITASTRKDPCVNLRTSLRAMLAD